MITYFDTSTIIPALDRDHENHVKATSILSGAMRSGEVATTTLHTFSELYNNLTRLGKGRPSLLPQQVEKLLFEVIAEQFMMVELDGDDYKAAVMRCSKLGLTGPVIYDALHLQAALKAGAEVLYTDNLRDFTRLQLPDDPISLLSIR